MNPEFVKQVVSLLPFWSQVRLAGVLGVWEGPRVEKLDLYNPLDPSIWQLKIYQGGSTFYLRDRADDSILVDWYGTGRVICTIMLDIRPVRTRRGPWTRTHRLVDWWCKFGGRFWDEFDPTYRHVVHKLNQKGAGPDVLLRHLHPSLRPFLIPLVESCIWKQTR